MKTETSRESGEFKAWYDFKMCRHCWVKVFVLLCCSVLLLLLLPEIAVRGILV